MIFLLTADLTPLKFSLNWILLHIIKCGTPIFSRGGMNDLRTDITETCLGSLYLQQGKGIQKNCKFEISTAKEQVFKNRKPVTVGPGTTITRESG